MPAQDFALISRQPGRAGRILALLAMLAFESVFAQAGDTVNHSLSFPQRHNQYVHVEADFPVTGDRIELVMPSWTPGSYLIRDFAAHVERFEARDPSGQPLLVAKTAKNRWRILSGGSERVSVSYDVWAGELNVSTSWVESDTALINGAGVFLFAEHTLDLPQSLSVVMPPDWVRLDTSLVAGEGNGVFTAADFDELVDSPIVAGGTQAWEFTVDDQEYALILSAENPAWDGDRSSEDLASLVAAHNAFWGVNPFERKYLFFNFFMGPYGGLEHDHSTVMMSDAWQMRSEQDYIKWLGLVSHEFFHAWNVRRMRPEALAEYDYESEVYTRELWLAEGLTSYYDDLLLFRSGLVDVSDYFRLLAKEIRNYETMPGREVRSAELASFDTWIKHYKPDENSINSTVSYYRKGALIGLILDAEIRRSTDGKRSLDTVMREMYARYGRGGSEKFGYPPGAFAAVVESQAGSELRALLDEMLRSTDDLPVDRALQWYGLSLNRAPGRSAAEKSGDVPPAGLGVNWSESGSALLVDQVLLGNSGAEAGLLPGDELIAIDGFRVTPANHLARFQRLSPNQEVTLTIVRHERLMTLPARVQHAIPDTYLIVPDSKISRKKQKRMEGWLGRPLVFKR